MSVLFPCNPPNSLPCAAAERHFYIPTSHIALPAPVSFTPLAVSECLLIFINVLTFTASASAGKGRHKDIKWWARGYRRGLQWSSSVLAPGRCPHLWTIPLIPGSPWSKAGGMWWALQSGEVARQTCLCLTFPMPTECFLPKVCIPPGLNI